MPNHVSHRVVVRGPAEDLARFKATHIVHAADEDGDAVTLDFNTIIPMPEILRGSESSSTVTNGLVVLGRGDLVRRNSMGIGKSTLEEMLEYPWVKNEGITDVETLKQRLIERERAIKAFEECGHTDWYSWSTECWGTKWNAYSFHVHDDEPRLLHFVFDTAWSPPEPIFARLAELWPTLDFAIAAFDEGHNFGFRGRIRDGQYEGATCDASDDLYEIVYGYPPEREDDDDSVDSILRAAMKGEHPVERMIAGETVVPLTD